MHLDIKVGQLEKLCYNIFVREILAAVMPFGRFSISGYRIYQLLNRKMSIKITVLKTGEQIISDMKVKLTEGQENAQAYILVNPHTYEINEKQFITEEKKEEGDFGIMSHFFLG